MRTALVVLAALSLLAAAPLAVADHKPGHGEEDPAPPPTCSNAVECLIGDPFQPCTCDPEPSPI